MAPIRRYLRVSKFSVLECRIYLDNPSDSRWLLNPRDPVLPRVFAAIRPLVLPKLREENERLFARKKSKPVKDVIAEDEFEVAIFLRETRTRHSLLTRSKTFHKPDNPDINAEGNSGPSTDPTGSADAGILVESDGEPDLDLHDIPEAAADATTPENTDQPNRRKRKTAQAGPAEEDSGDEKKLRFSTQYESFNICGWVLCLLVTRKGDRTRPALATSELSRQPLMEEWISTQAQASLDED
ncbi:hypothetical protein NUU61_005075 [Penicillium alfredii]|uniref:Uncharacterized protein n=1 Tax=Penicillium alfredii TaxID=1506179 RepID=A0A9W9F923_9EURO|nr:uncharacterized protein NUU61_005075 [Penicillium alfredii]KAJ5095719.1 hypothetical protein NUU61_005075 [Penicillium alfredii]